MQTFLGVHGDTISTQWGYGGSESFEAVSDTGPDVCLSVHSSSTARRQRGGRQEVLF